MKVKELIEKLSKLDPELYCFTLDSNAEYNRIVDVWLEQAATANGEDIAYVETTYDYHANEG
jgi:hypothetical protein